MGPVIIEQQRKRASQWRHSRLPWTHPTVRISVSFLMMTGQGCKRLKAWQPSLSRLFLTSKLGVKKKKLHLQPRLERSLTRASYHLSVEWGSPQMSAPGLRSLLKEALSEQPRRPPGQQSWQQLLGRFTSIPRCSTHPLNDWMPRLRLRRPGSISSLSHIPLSLMPSN
ncbi:unnamed protein product [Chrysoparadoxa australica]